MWALCRVALTCTGSGALLGRQACSVPANCQLVRQARKQFGARNVESHVTAHLHNTRSASPASSGAARLLQNLWRHLHWELGAQEAVRQGELAAVPSAMLGAR